jgi:protein archease
MSPAWEEIPHTADWALRVRGIDMRSLFENAARGMVSLIGGTSAATGDTFRRDFHLTAPDPEILLVDWLTGLLLLVEEEGALVVDIRVDEVAGAVMSASATARRGGQFSKYIKAVTYHNLAIHPTAEGFETVIVFDV